MSQDLMKVLYSERFILAPNSEDIGDDLKTSLGISGAGAVLSQDQLAAVLAAGGESAEIMARWAELSPRVWIQTKESARLVKDLDSVLTTNGNVLASFKKGRYFAANAEFLPTDPLSLLNPATLSALGGLVSNVASQHQMMMLSNKIDQVSAGVESVQHALTSARDSPILETANMVRTARETREKFGTCTQEDWDTLSPRIGVLRSKRREIFDEISKYTADLDKARSLAKKSKKLADIDRKLDDWLPLILSATQSLFLIRVLQTDRTLERHTREDMNAEDLEERLLHNVETTDREFQDDLEAITQVLNRLRGTVISATHAMNDGAVARALPGNVKNMNHSAASVFSKIEKFLAVFNKRYTFKKPLKTLNWQASVTSIASRSATDLGAEIAIQAVTGGKIKGIGPDVAQVVRIASEAANSEIKAIKMVVSDGSDESVKSPRTGEGELEHREQENPPLD